MTISPSHIVSYRRKTFMALTYLRSLTRLSPAVPLIAGALAACSGIDGLPDVPRPDAVDAGVAVPLSDASEVADSTIPDAFVADGGADAGTPDDAGPDSTLVDAATDATIADAGPCVAESDTALCTQLGKNCGTLAAVDHCGTSRAISSCGSCAGFYDTCGGGGAANVCGCTPESDWSLCWRQGRSCGQASGTDNCGNSRSVAACGGACPADAGAADATVPDGGNVQCGTSTCAPGAVCRQGDAGGQCDCDFRSTGLVGDGTFCEPLAQIEPAGFDAACLRTVGGRVGCWGRNTDGTLGTGDNNDRTRPSWISLNSLPRVAKLEGNLARAGQRRICALTWEGRIYCWGKNASFVNSSTPLPSSNVPAQFSNGLFSSVRLLNDPRSIPDLLCAETVPSPATGTRTVCYGPSYFSGLPQVNVLSASTTAVGWFSGGTVLWKGSGCAPYNAAGIYNDNGTCFHDGESTMAEQSDLIGTIVLTDWLTRFTSRGVYAFIGASGCPAANYNSNTNWCQFNQVSNAWKGGIFQIDSVIEIGVPGGASNTPLTTLEPGETVAAAGAFCVATSNHRFVCAMQSQSPAL
jgi:hypothetical protein